MIDIGIAVEELYCSLGRTIFLREYNVLVHGFCTMGYFYLMYRHAANQTVSWRAIDCFSYFSIL